MLRLTAAALALLAAGCGSNNTEKFVGNWEVLKEVPLPPPEPDGRRREREVLWVFNSDKSFEKKELVDRPSGKAEWRTLVTGHYRLGYGDRVYLSMIDPPTDRQTEATVTAKIEPSHIMLVTEKNGQTHKLFRLCGK